MIPLLRIVWVKWDVCEASNEVLVHSRNAAGTRCFLLTFLQSSCENYCILPNGDAVTGVVATLSDMPQFKGKWGNALGQSRLDCVSVRLLKGAGYCGWASGVSSQVNGLVNGSLWLWPSGEPTCLPLVTQKASCLLLFLFSI